MENEILKKFPVKEYEKQYQVSNRGKIWSNRKKDYLRAKEGYIGITRGSLSSKYVENKISEFYLK